MGIRFEKDTRRATNGPLIFFSILKDESFEEEIRSAFFSGLSFYAYRFPGDSMMTYGSSEGYLEGMDERKPGFIIGSFSPDKPILTIPYDGIKRSEIKTSLYKMPCKSTNFEEYSFEVSEIIRDIQSGKGSKVVAARTILKDTDFDIAEKFYELCRRFPEAFVFCFSTPATGCWIGASPELLLEGREGNLKSMALAGTRTANTSTPWDDKNVREQEIVADYIYAIFKMHNLTAEIGPTFNKVTGKIEHICTPISARIDDKEGFKLESFLKDLAPTPALCGFPKEFALKEISRLEKFDRGCYGGFCGPFRSLMDFSFNVVLRCASVDERKYCVYVGGGITAKSTVESEWKETALKVSNTFG